MGEKTPAQVAKELREAQKLIGKKVIGIPGKDATPEEHRAYHTARGVPESADGYQFDDVLEELAAAAPEGFARDEAREKEFRELAKAANLSNAEARELIKRQLSTEFEKSKDTIKAHTEATTKAKALMVENWGPNVEGKTLAANKFVRQIGFDDDMLEAFMSVAGTKPEARFKLVDFFAQQGELLRENPGGGGGEIMAGDSLSPDQARIAKEQFLSQGDNRQAYTDSSHARHKAVTDQMTVFLKAERGVK